MEDMSGRLNLNSLVDTTGRPNVTQIAVFKALLASAGLEFPTGLAISPHGHVYVSNYGVLPATGGPAPTRCPPPSTG